MNASEASDAIEHILSAAQDDSSPQAQFSYGAVLSGIPAGASVQAFVSISSALGGEGRPTRASFAQHVNGATEDVLAPETTTQDIIPLPPSIPRGNASGSTISLPGAMQAGTFLIPVNGLEVTN